MTIVTVQIHDARHQTSQVGRLREQGDTRCGFRRKRLLNIAGRSSRAAARLFRERGIGATGVDSITKEAGLTHGAVYSRFGSKEAIAIESVRLALRGSKRAWLRELEQKGRRRLFPRLSSPTFPPAHRDDPGTGCVVAALGGDISRQPKSVRDAFTRSSRTH